MKLSLSISLFFLILLPLTTQWCFKTIFNIQTQASVLDTSYDNAYIAIASASSNVVYIYDLPNYNQLFKYQPPGSRTVKTARFSVDGAFLGVGTSDGTIYLLRGRPPFNSTQLLKVGSSVSQTIADIAFNQANSKLMACYTSDNRVTIYFNYTGTMITYTNATSNDSIKCKFGYNDDIVLIDDNNRARIYNAAGSSTYSQNSSNDLKDIDVKPGYQSTVSFVTCGANDLGYTGANGTGSLSANTFIGTDPNDNMAAACYAGDGQYYAYGGGSSSQKRTFIFNSSNSNVQNFQDSSNGFLSCVFSRNGQYLFLGTTTSNNIANIFVYKKVCSDCLLGTYQVGSTCIACSTIAAFYGCSHCSSATKCLSCYQGFFLNQTTFLCQRCNYLMQGCSSCTYNLTCLECNSNYYVNASGLCQTCHSSIPGCLSCNSSSTCLTCAPDYYNSSTGSCVKCTTIANCVRCFNISLCTECQMGFYVDNGSCIICSTNCTVCYNSSTNCSSCVRSFYMNISACVSCSSNCLECNNTNYCFDCQTGYYPSATGTCQTCSYPCEICNASNYCLSCIFGYFNQNGTCVQCSSNCSTCSNTTNNCTNCQFGYYLTASKLCLSCHFLHSNCSTCNVTNCYACQNGYYLNSSNICSSCAVLGCALCNSTSYCQLCSVGFYLTASNSCSLCTSGCETCQIAAANCSSCSTGFYLSSNSCVACSSNCTTCNSSQCFSCILGFYQNSGSCTSCFTIIYGCIACLNSTTCLNCLSGTYLNSTSQCSVCPLSCSSCNSTACHSCNLGFYLSSSSCLKCQLSCSECTASNNCFSCNIGYFMNSSLTTNQCTPCGTINRYCLTCNSTYCYNCQRGSYLDPTTHSCLSCSSLLSNCLDCLNSSLCQQCQQGYYLSTTNNSCLACSMSIQGCQRCSSNILCISCAMGYYFSSPSCISCPINCSVCNSTTCTTCAISYTYNSSSTSCVTCDSYLIGCQVCLNSTFCHRCSNGYYLNSNTCSSCSIPIGGCAYCNSSAICTRCMDGYYLSASGCQLCSISQGCRLCNSSAICTSCESGYILSVNTCVLCSSLIHGCIYCQSSSQCSLCQSGYAVNGGICSTCDSLIPACTSCYNSTVCQSCEGGYYLNSTTGCSSCLVRGCSVCNSSLPNSCINCGSGYFLNASSCIACNVSGCLQCSISSQCISCEVGYYLKTDNTCELCTTTIAGCSMCSNSSVCLECQSMFYLSSGSCLACSSVINGCGFCTNSSYCLSCDSGYYLNSSSLCSLCTTLNGCILCATSTNCLFCNTGYYLNAGVCQSCSSINNCSQCYNSTLCTACQSGYEVTAAGVCNAMQISSGSSSPIKQIKQLKFKTTYIDQNTLKHTLQVRGMKYTQNNQNWATCTKIYIQNKNSSTLLTITRTEWGRYGNSIHFYTNNPLNLNVKTISFARLLIGQSIDTNFKSSIALNSAALSSILPNLLHSGDLAIGYSLNDPQFYNSFIAKVYNTYYYIIGIVVTVLLLFNFIIRATCTVTHSQNHGDIMGHVFALKVVSIVLYPTFAEYINYCYGFMTADMPWLNAFIGQSIGDSSDISPYGFLLYYSNMSLFSMYLLPLLVFMTLLGFSYVMLKKQSVSQYKLTSKKEQLKAKSNNKFKAIAQCLFNFFHFGLVFAGCASFQGALLNPSDLLTINGISYISGIILFVSVLAQAIYSFVKQWKFSHLRIFIKGTLLCFAHFNPIYIVAVALLMDLVLMITECKMKHQAMVSVRLWFASNLFANISLAVLFYIPDSLLSIIVSAAVIGALILIQFYIHLIQKRINVANYPLFNKAIVSLTRRINPDQNQQTDWKLNTSDYSLQKQVIKKPSHQDKQFIFQQPFDSFAETKFMSTKFTTNTNLQNNSMKDSKTSIHDGRRNRRFNIRQRSNRIALQQSTQNWKQLQSTFNSQEYK